ncbi:MAG TPA: site-2 protease family protein [Balneolales bacterium]|nr:site-2 protease family protein [Balneolales bacterium]
MLDKIRKKSWNIAGFKITVDPFLIIILILLTWLLSDRYYPRFTYRPDTLIYWIMGVTTALALTFSILIHELGHAFTARLLHIPIERIHLFLFGGMAELRHRPIQPKDELLVAISGPIVSISVAAICYYASILIKAHQLESFFVLQNIALMNALLGGFNLVPVFPLDGGRALRAFLWIFKKGYNQASKLTYSVGKEIILVLFIISAVLYFYYDRNLSIWLVLFSFYMVYTVFTGRKELIYSPELDDLIMDIDQDATPILIIEKLDSSSEDFLKKSIIPVLNDNKVIHVLYGKDLERKVGQDIPDFEPYLQPVEPGTYVDLDQYDTYNPDLTYKADFVPIFYKGVLKGMCDAHEMRFWLLERYGTVNIS